MRVPFNCEGNDLIRVVILSGCNKKYIGQMQIMLKERLNTYRQHIGQSESQQTDVESHIRTCDGGNFKIMLFR